MSNVDIFAKERNKKRDQKNKKGRRNLATSILGVVMIILRRCVDFLEESASQSLQTARNLKTIKQKKERSKKASKEVSVLWISTTFSASSVIQEVSIFKNTFRIQ